MSLAPAATVASPAAAPQLDGEEPLTPPRRGPVAPHQAKEEAAVIHAIDFGKVLRSSSAETVVIVIQLLAVFFFE